MKTTVNRKRLSFVILALILGLSIFFALMLPKIILDNELRHFFPEQNDSYKRFNDLEKTFGDQYIMDIVIETNEGIILEKKYLNIIKKLSEELETLDNIVNVKSLTNIDFITSADDTVLTGKLIPEEYYVNAKELELKQRILEWPKAYLGTIISDDFKGIQIVCTLDSSATPPEATKLYYDVVDTVEKNLKSEKSLEYKIAGEVVLGEYAKIFMYADLEHLIPLIALVVLLCLFFSFKNWEGTLLPLGAVLISTIWTAGIMALIGEPLTIVSSCLPVLLIAVGSAYGIHIINYYYQRLEKSALITSVEEHQNMLIGTLKHAKSPVLLAGLTTVAGFASTITSPIKPLKSFAIFSALGIIIALALAFTFIPAILMLKPLKLIQKQQKRISQRNIKKNARLAAMGMSNKDAMLDKVYYSLNRRRGAFVASLLIIIAVSVWGILNLNVESAFLEYFPKQSKLYEDVAYIDENYVGSTGFSFIVEGKEKGDMCKPEILKQMDNMEKFLKSRHSEIGTILSFTEFMKRMNQVMNAETSEIEESQDESGDSGLAEDDDFFADGESTEEDDFFAEDEEKEEDDFFAEDEEEMNETDAEENIESENKLVANDFIAKYRGKTFTADEAVALFTLAYAEANSSDISVSEFIDSLKRCLNYKGAAYYEIPYDVSKYPASTKAELKNIITQYLLLYSGSLEDLIDDNSKPKKSRMQVIMRTHDTAITKDVIEDAKAFAEHHFPEGYTLEAAGLGELEVAMTSMIISSQVSSLLMAVVIVFCILSVVYRSPIAGIIGSIPLAISILLNFGIMSLVGINLDMVTSLVAAIAIGIGIDYTVHFMNNYHHERIANDDLTEVTLKTLKYSGKGIAVNAFSVGAGFLVLCFSKFVVLRFVGFLVAVVMLTSSVAALTILPVILNIFKPKFMAKTKTNKGDAK